MKTFVFDVDGVILNFNKSFIKYVNKRLKEKYKYKEEYIISYDYSVSLGLSKELTNRLFCEFMNTDYIKKLQYFKYIKNFINDLYDKKYEIILLTAFDESKENEREYNLRQLNYDHIYFTENKLDFIKKIKPDYIFEDSPKYIYDYIENKEYFKQLFIPLRTYNNHYFYKWYDNNSVLFYNNEMLKIFKNHLANYLYEK